MKIPNSNKKLDYYMPSDNFGLLLAEWKKPISIRVIDRAIYTLNHFDLDELIIITNSLSDYASSTLKKLDLPIKAIFSSNVSDLAMKIASLSSSKSSLMMKRVQTA